MDQSSYFILEKLYCIDLDYNLLFNIKIYEISFKWFSNDYNVTEFNLESCNICDIFNNENLLKLINKCIEIKNENSELRFNIRKQIQHIPYVRIYDISNNNN